MEVLSHYIFELFKITILAAVYATIIMFILSRIGKSKPDSWFAKVLKKKIVLWFTIGFLISIQLFAYLFTYWGDHGLGDNARIPVGYGKAVQQIDGNWTYITPNGCEDETLSIDEYATVNGILIAKISGDRAEERNAECIGWNLRTNAVEFLQKFADLEDFKTKYNIAGQLRFLNFREHYNNYWSGWRFWLLA